MPQMMPINWLISFFFFLILFIIFIIMNYYMMNYSNKNNFINNKMTYKNIFWKW